MAIGYANGVGSPLGACDSSRNRFSFNNISGQGMANPLRVSYALHRPVGSFL